MCRTDALDVTGVWMTSMTIHSVIVLQQLKRRIIDPLSVVQK